MFRRAIRVAAAPRRRHRLRERPHRAAPRASCAPRRAGCSWSPTASTTTASVPSDRRRRVAADDAARRRAPRPARRAAPYVLFVGTLEPRKAVPDLVAAFDRVADRPRPSCRWSSPASPGWGVEAVERAIGQARAADRDRPHRLRPRRRRAGPAAPGRGGRLPRPRGGLRPARPRGAGVRHAARHHGGHGHGRGRRAAPRSWCRRGRCPSSPTPSTTPSTGGAAVRATPPARASRWPPRHTWEASAADHLSAYRWAATPCRSDRPRGTPAPVPGKVRRVRALVTGARGFVGLVADRASRRERGRGGRHRPRGRDHRRRRGARRRGRGRPRRRVPPGRARQRGPVVDRSRPRSCG